MPACPAQLISYLEAMVSPRRLERLDQVLRFRTHHLVIVLEDIYNWHNASAALRSAEIFGIQQVHTIENRYSFSRNSGVDLGSSKWLTLHQWRNPAGENTLACLRHLKDSGYRIVATSPEAPSEPPDQLDLSRPAALCFGTELDGLSPQAQELADARVRLPMFGFTTSFNVSVSCALVLSALVPRLHQSRLSWQLTDLEREELRFLWLRKSIQNSDPLIAEWLREHGLPADTVPPLPAELPDRGRRRK